MYEGDSGQKKERVFPGTDVEFTVILASLNLLNCVYPSALLAQGSEPSAVSYY